jgi:hypothetical protein
VLADQTPAQLVHPSIATVTYLTDAGAPTLVVEAAPLTMPKVDLHGTNAPHPRETVAKTRTAFLSQPAAGKHIGFDGR